MIKWKRKLQGNCPVQAEGYFMNYYFYFRARWDKATIEFSKTKAGWENELIHARYILATVDSPEAGWLPKWLCRILIWIGCIKFFFKQNKHKTI
jgi:hypothetical protein